MEKTFMFEPFNETKVWGSVFHLFASPHAAVSLLNVNAGTRCSRHKHQDRANQFAVGLVEFSSKFLYIHFQL